VDSGLEDVGPGVVEDDPSVHLGELGEPGRAEDRRLERETARAGLVDQGAISQHDEAALALLDDPLQGPAHRGAGRKSFEGLGYRRSTHVHQE
jgi:hypothetical protein